MTITVYSKKGCGKCVGTKRHLELNDIPHAVVMVDENPDIADQLISEGYLELPVVKVSDGDSWSGLDINKLRALDATLF